MKTTNALPSKKLLSCMSVFGPNHEILILGQGSARKQLLTNKNGYVSVLLRWNSSTTKIGSNSRFVSCGAYPITPVDVNSRPSTCLTNFVLTGDHQNLFLSISKSRTVLLEIPNVGDKDGTKCISHILTNHHGRIYMHSLPVSENVMGKIPSLFELPITNPFNNALHQQRIERPPPLMRLELPLSVPTVVAQPPPHLPRTAAAASPAHAAKPPDLTRQQLLDALKQARSSSGAVVTGLPTVDRHGKPIKNMISYLKNQLQKKRRVLHVSPDAKKARTPAMLRVIDQL
uniref:Protein asunder n=1 Tax=Romanomermis culicivorax TaxID=13658 RepID=A0A915JCM8_ROMCU